MIRIGQFLLGPHHFSVKKRLIVCLVTGVAGILAVEKAAGNAVQADEEWFFETIKKGKEAVSVTNQDKIFIKSENIVRRNIADEIILVPIRGNMADMKKVFSLDAVADFIWMQLDGTRSCRDIHKALLANFTVEADQAASDLDGFIDELLQAALIREVA